MHFDFAAMAFGCPPLAAMFALKKNCQAWRIFPLLRFGQPARNDFINVRLPRNDLAILRIPCTMVCALRVEAINNQQPLSQMQFAQFNFGTA
jgi:hypothetical protein